MKKLLTIVLAGGMLAFYACGPSKEEIAKKQKATQDSIQAVQDAAAKATADAAKAKQDSTDAANAKMAADAKAKAEADSMEMAKKSPKKGGATKPKAPKTAAAAGRPGATKK